MHTLHDSLVYTETDNFEGSLYPEFLSNMVKVDFSQKYNIQSSKPKFTKWVLNVVMQTLHDSF